MQVVVIEEITSCKYLLDHIGREIHGFTLRLYSTFTETISPQTPVLILIISGAISINSSENVLARAAHEIEGLEITH